MRLGDFHEKRYALGEAIFLVKRKRFKSIQEAYNMIINQAGHRITLDNGLIYGFDARYGGFVIFDTDGLTVLSPFCPVFVCDGHTAGGHICKCAIYANRPPTCNSGYEESPIVQMDEQEPVMPDPSHVHNFIKEIGRTIRLSTYGRRSKSYTDGAATDIRFPSGLATFRHWAMMNNFNPIQLPDNSKMMIRCYPQCDPVFICTNEAQFPLCTGLTLTDSYGESTHEPCGNRAIHADKRNVQCPTHFKYMAEQNPTHFHRRALIIGLVELFDLINTGLSVEDDQSLLAKWIRVVRYLYGRGLQGVVVTRAGIKMRIFSDEKFHICYNSTGRVYKLCCFPFCLYAAYLDDDVGLCKKHNKLRLSHYGLSRKQYGTLLKGDLDYGEFANLDNKREDHALMKSAAVHSAIRKVVVPVNKNQRLISQLNSLLGG